MNLIDRLACDVLLRTQICPRQMKVLDMCSVIRFFDLESIDESIELTAKMGVSRTHFFLVRVSMLFSSKSLIDLEIRVDVQTLD